MAEALVELDRIADAVTLLNPEGVTDISTCPPEVKSEQGQSYLLVFVMVSIAILIFKSAPVPLR